MSVYVYCICLVFNLLYYLEHRFYCDSIYIQWCVYYLYLDLLDF
jgi:hypothetical protein